MSAENDSDRSRNDDRAEQSTSDQPTNTPSAEQSPTNQPMDDTEAPYEVLPLISKPDPIFKIEGERPQEKESEDD